MGCGGRPSDLSMARYLRAGSRTTTSSALGMADKENSKSQGLQRCHAFWKILSILKNLHTPLKPLEQEFFTSSGYSLNFFGDFSMKQVRRFPGVFLIVTRTPRASQKKTNGCPMSKKQQLYKTSWFLKTVFLELLMASC